jgi:hypothetical protein
MDLAVEFGDLGEHGGTGAGGFLDRVADPLDFG